ncbi:MAG: dihydrolipoamide acetyltransferase family protein [Planctomycetota bacterium]|jgi:pyruvate dehydrogenase E2 component (dihydrolipoamide acetyltransferase)
MAIKEFKLPDIGEGIAEGEIVQWMVEVGQEVKEEDPFVEVMTDKATVTITAPFDAVVIELRFNAGDIVPVETVIAVFEVGGEAGSAEPVAAAAPARVAPASAATAATEIPAKAPAKAAAQAPAKPFVQAAPGKVLAAPATRRRAREIGIDLHQVPGTGPRGRITNQDLAAFASSGAAVATTPPVTTPPAPAAPARPVPTPPTPATPTPVAVPPTPPGVREERKPFVGLRRKIAEAMHRSKSTAAHFTYVDEINVTELVELRRQAKESYREQGINITYLPFIMKAVVEGMRQFPTMNSSLDESTNEQVIKHYYNIGVATDTDNGLIVPVVKDVDQKNIAQLAYDIQTLAQRTREGTVSVDDLQGGTFTITNAGNIGGLFATPVINFPEVAILGVNAIRKTPIVQDDQIVVGDVMYLSVSIDHRIVDGATGARWMNVVKECLENPTRLLLGSL